MSLLFFQGILKIASVNRKRDRRWRRRGNPRVTGCASISRVLEGCAQPLYETVVIAAIIIDSITNDRAPMLNPTFPCQALASSYSILTSLPYVRNEEEPRFN